MTRQMDVRVGLCGFTMAMEDYAPTIKEEMTVTCAKGTGSDRQVQARSSDHSTIFDPRLN